MSIDGMHWLPSLSALHGVSTFLLLFRGWGTFFFVKSSRWNFLTLNLQLCREAQSKIPLVLVMMLHSLSWVEEKPFPVTKMAASLTKSSILSPSLISEIFSKLEL